VIRKAGSDGVALQFQKAATPNSVQSDPIVRTSIFFTNEASALPAKLLTI
jgi:hypothetical protein